MPATLEVNVELTPQQLAGVINQLDEDELENLLILLEQDLAQELIERRHQARVEFEADELLTTGEIFEELA